MSCQVLSRNKDFEAECARIRIGSRMLPRLIGYNGWQMHMPKEGLQERCTCRLGLMHRTESSFHEYRSSSLHKGSVKQLLSVQLIKCQVPQPRGARTSKKVVMQWRIRQMGRRRRDPAAACSCLLCKELLALELWRLPAQ